jgi:hypothetical protein
MKRFLGNIIFDVCLAIVLIVVVIWVLDDNSISSKLDKQQISDQFDSGIEKIDVKFDDGEIYLDIYTDKSLTCKNIIKLLNVDILIIKDKVYSPKCVRMEEDLIRITYIEDITA